MFGKDGEKLESSYTAGRKSNWLNHSGKHSGNPSKNYS